MEISKILSDRRRKIGMSIDDLVAASGVPRGTVTKVLVGITKDPGIETLKSITYALGLSLEDLDDKKEPVTMDGLSENEKRFMSVWRELTPMNQRLLIEIGAAILRAQETPPD